MKPSFKHKYLFNRNRERILLKSRHSFSEIDYVKSEALYDRRYSNFTRTFDKRIAIDRNTAKCRSIFFS